MGERYRQIEREEWGGGGVKLLGREQIETEK